LSGFLGKDVGGGGGRGGGGLSTGLVAHQYRRQDAERTSRMPAAYAPFLRPLPAAADQLMIATLVVGKVGLGRGDPVGRLRRRHVLGIEDVEHGGRQGEEDVLELARLLHHVVDQHPGGRPRRYPWLVVEYQPVGQIVPHVGTAVGRVYS